MRLPSGISRLRDRGAWPREQLCELRFLTVRSWKRERVNMKSSASQLCRAEIADNYKHIWKVAVLSLSVLLSDVRIQGSRPGIMLTCIVSFMAITHLVSEGEGLQ